MTIRGAVLDGRLNPTGSTREKTAAAPAASIRRDVGQDHLRGQRKSLPCRRRWSLTPGDAVTYRWQYNFVLGDFEKFTFEDFLPLPIFRVGDPDANDYVAADARRRAGLDGAIGQTPSTRPRPLPPRPGQWKRGPADTLTPIANANGDGTRGTSA